MSELNKEYESSLKSIETENKLDRIFYRPIGFYIARALVPTKITPNMVTIVSIFIGAAAGYFFYVNNILYAICGILLLVVANILDCVDGQLARLTGIKSAVGRILDGLAGDIWFTSIYVGMALRLMNEYGTPYFFVLAVLSGLSHLVQANATDYYKTLHLFFISKEKGGEFKTLKQIKAEHKAMPLGINKTLYWFYTGYTLLQILITPKLQNMLFQLSKTYGEDMPESVRLCFRKRSCRLMPYIDLFTFNGRTVVLFAVMLFGQHIWIYFLYEIIVLNILLFMVMRAHEKMCEQFSKEYAK